MHTYSDHEYVCIALLDMGALLKMASIAVTKINRPTGGNQMVQKRRKASSFQDDSNNLTSNVRRTAISLAVAAALPSAMAMPMAAYAQDEASDEVIEEIVTYGSFRQSLINSITTKRDNSKIVEAISAE
ncbi:MAG: hypothetical protein WBM34_03660, partial [Woeseiaceae bacterium]